MCVNMPPMMPRFIKQLNGAGEVYGVKQSFVNIDDIANLEQVGPNYWEADSKHNLKSPNGQDKAYHFDDNGAKQILSYYA